MQFFHDGKIPSKSRRVKEACIRSNVSDGALKKLGRYLLSRKHIWVLQTDIFKFITRVLLQAHQ